MTKTSKVKGLEELDNLLDPPVAEEVLEDMPLAEFLPRGYLSVSQANTYLNCPYQWYLRYVMKKPVKTSIRMFEGVNVHKAAEAVLAEKSITGKVPDLSMALDVFNDAFETSKPLINDWDDIEPGKAKDNGVNITKVFHKQTAPVAAPVEVEKSFYITVGEGKAALPVSGRIDSIQVKLANPEKDYDPEKAKKAPKLHRRIHDLKVTTDKWGPNDLKNDLQFAVYAYAESIPDVAVDMLVKGRAKDPRPRYEHMNDVITPEMANHSMDVLSGVANGIALGYFPKCAPDAWHCSEKWCSVWTYCRGKKK